MEKIFKKFIRDTEIAIGISAGLLYGPAGTGKTFFTKMLAEFWQASYLFYQCHIGTGKEDLLYDLDIRGVVEKLSGGSATHYIQPGLLLRAAEASTTEKVVLVLDEIDKSHPSLDAFLLDFLQNGRISDPFLGTKVSNTKNLIVLLTSNQERELSEPLLRRLRRVRFDYPSPEEEMKIISSMVGSNIIPTEKIKFIIAVANWLRRNDGVVKKPTTPELARLVIDLARAETQDEKVEAFLSWMIFYEEDKALLIEKFTINYLRGIL